MLKLKPSSELFRVVYRLIEFRPANFVGMKWSASWKESFLDLSLPSLPLAYLIARLSLQAWWKGILENQIPKS